LLPFILGLLPTGAATATNAKDAKVFALGAASAALAGPPLILLSLASGGG
jgi:hypothetical protein